MDVFKDMLRSKKFQALLAALLVWLVAFFGLDLGFEKVALLIGTIATYIVGQGVADKGKEAAKEVAKVEFAKMELQAAEAKRRPSKRGS